MANRATGERFFMGYKVATSGNLQTPTVRHIKRAPSAREILETLDNIEHELAELINMFALRSVLEDSNLSFYEEVERFEVLLISSALKKTAGSQIKAAKLLRLKNTTLNAKMKRLGLTVPAALGHVSYANLTQSQTGDTKSVPGAVATG
jgi:transcriptional regulator with GAF, ATPase, and Fis domain